jgi:response regulator of citrate/malate metabolism
MPAAEAVPDTARAGTHRAVSSVVVVDDDFRVARLHAEVVGGLEDLEVVAVVHTASAALDAACRHRPDLVLLDLYLPDASGLELLRRFRSLPAPPDVIVISAARDAGSVRAAMRAGVLQFLVKPLDFDSLRERLRRYAQLQARLAERRELDQCEIDALLVAMQPEREAQIATRLPKGCSPGTADLVLGALQDGDGPRSAADVADIVGISRWTAQRYLATLAGMGLVHMQPQYGATGRPEHRYTRVRG